jgi:hypothetical protein
MTGQTTPKATAGCLVVLAIVILVMTFVTTASLNPLAVYASSSIWAKILVSLLAALLVASLIQAVFWYLLRKQIEVTTGKRADDVICPGDGLPLLQYSFSHGVPVRCPTCGTWWHSGPACYRKDVPRSGTGIRKYLCPHCRTDEPRERDLFDDEGALRLG